MNIKSIASRVLQDLKGPVRMGGFCHSPQLAIEVNGGVHDSRVTFCEQASRLSMQLIRDRTVTRFLFTRVSDTLEGYIVLSCSIQD